MKLQTKQGSPKIYDSEIRNKYVKSVIDSIL